MTVKEMYTLFSEHIPEHLSEEWDNDGLMCCPDGTAKVRRALITLDVTEEIVDYAIEYGFDLIISHHPLVFKPVCALVEDNHVSRKLIKLVNSGISVFSFHTRADKVTGGVNDKLSELLCDVKDEEKQEVLNALNRRTEFRVLRTTYGTTLNEYKPEEEEKKAAAKREEEAEENFIF